MFERIEPTYLAWGLYLSTCLENEVELGSKKLPYEYIASYDYRDMHGNNIFYGGEIGVFHELKNNIYLLSDIYHEQKDFIFTSEERKNPLYNAIVSRGTIGYSFNIPSIGGGIFCLDEVTIIQQLLKSEIGIKKQFDYLKMNLYQSYNKSINDIILSLRCDYNAKILLCTYAYWQDDVIRLFYSYNEENNIQSLDEMFLFLCHVKESDIDRLVLLYQYIVKEGL